MPKVTVIEANIWRVIKNECKPKWVEWDNQPIKIEIDFDQALYKKLDKDPLLQAKLWEAAGDVYRDFVKASKKTFKEADTKFGRLYSSVTGPELKRFAAESDKLYKWLTSEMENHEAELKKDVPRAVDAAWKALKKKNTGYRNLKIKAVVSVSLRLTSVAFAAVGLFSNPFTAGPGILAIQTLVSGTLSSLQDCVKLAKSAATLRQSTETLMATLKKRYASGVKKANLVDFSLANVKTVFGVDASSLGTAGKNLKLYRQKLVGVDQKSHSVAQKLQKALKECDKARRDSGDFFGAQMSGDFKELERTINSLIETVIGLQQSVHDGERWADKQDKALAVLTSKKPYALSIVEKLLGTALAGAKIGMDYADMQKLADSGTKQAGHAVKIANTLYHNYQTYEKERKAIAKKLKRT